MKKKRETGGPHEQAQRMITAALPRLARKAIKLAERGRPTLLRVLRRMLTEHAQQMTDPEADAIIKRLAQGRTPFAHHVPRPKRPRK